MNAAELRTWLDENRRFLLLDVLPPEAHEEWRIPGSRNAPVYESAFPDRVAKLGAPKEEPVVVYCSSRRSRASAEAARILAEAGYRDVREFEGGREEWSDAGFPVEGTAADRPWDGALLPRAGDGRYELDREKSLIQWTGRNAANSHYGTLRFAGGSLAVEKGELAAGEAVADMRTIAVDDLQGEAARMLLRHLATGDFFLTDRHPTATFRLEGADPVPGAAAGQINVNVRGSLELRGVRSPLSFAAVFAPAGEGGVALQGAFQLDRTRFGSHYGSGRFFERLGMHLVNDQVTIQVRLVATR